MFTFEFGIYRSVPTADPKTYTFEQTESTDPVKINAMLPQVEDGVTGDAYIGMHGDFLAADFPCIGGGHPTDPELHGTRKAFLFFGTGEKYVISLENYESLRRDVFQAYETVKASKEARKALENVCLDA